MRKFIAMAAIAVVVAALSAGCDSKDDDNKTSDGPVVAPVISLVGGDIDAVHEIATTMSVKVNVKAEGGIDAFGIKIESPALTEEILGEFGLSTQMDLVTPASEAMAATLKGFGFPVGADVEGKTEVTFDISKLVPMIAVLYNKTSDHNFELTVMDSKSQTTVKTLKFHFTGTTDVAYNNDADLWANTATLTVKLGVPADDPVVEYKKSTESVWQKALIALDAAGTYTATIAPEWKAEADHASGTKQYSLDGKTGVFAGQTYEFRLVNGGVAVDGTEGTFTTAAGKVIPGGDMETWGRYNGYSNEESAAAVFYPNADKEHGFWSNGNNAITQTLCQPDTLANNTYAAKLKGYAISFLNMFAAGNLYTGNFEMEGLAGYACFGQKYTFTARPRALVVRYKSTITKLEVLGLKTDSGEVTLEDLDRARIFVCITDWNTQHRVHSGYGVTIDQVNAFDPDTDLQPAEGKVIAYGSKWIDASAGDWTSLIIPILYNDQAAKPGADVFSLVISASASGYGDFLCGSGSNELYLDDIEWVY